MEYKEYAERLDKELPYDLYIIEHQEFFRKTRHYDDWTARSQLPTNEKAALEQFILNSDPHIRSYFEVVVRPEKHLESFTSDFILLKGRKATQ